MDTFQTEKKCITQVEAFQVVCTCRHLLRTTLSALNNLWGVKVLYNTEKEQDIC